jgi:hypothetical protein
MQSIILHIERSVTMNPEIQQTFMDKWQRYFPGDESPGKIYSYRGEEVSYQTLQPGITLAGTLIIPKKKD